MQTQDKSQPSDHGFFSYKIVDKSSKSTDGKEIFYSEIFISGKLEFLTGFELEKNFCDIIEVKSDRLVVNLKEVTFINSLGLNFLLNEYEKCRKKNIKFYISNAGDYVMKVFTITRLDSIFKLLNDSAACADGE